MADLATLQARRVEVDAAYHDLMLGKGVVEVMRDGRKITYNRSSASLLREYITELDDAIAAAGGAASTAPRRGSMRPMFA